MWIISLCLSQPFLPKYVQVTLVLGYATYWCSSWSPLPKEKDYFTLLYFNVQISSLLFRFLFYNLIIPIRKRNTCFHLCFFLLIGTTSLEARCQKCMGYQIYPRRICPWKHIFNTSWARASLGEHETWARLDRWRGGTPIFWTVFISWE